jgi:hypothetical protein
MRKTGIVATGLVLPILLAGSAMAAGFEMLAPHRAVYDMKLREATDRSGIQAMSGRIVYEVTGNECDGLTVRYRFVTSIATSAESWQTDQQTSTFESPDGRTFNFHTRSMVGDQVESVVRGSASRGGDGVTVELSQPASRRLELPPASFISTHLVEVLRAAESGETLVKSDIFDGSDKADEIVASSTFIGAAKLAPKPFDGESAASIGPLENLKAWPVTVSYFEKTSQASAETTPMYQASFLLYPNGISRRLIMRYPDYSLTGNLASLEMLPKEPCK